MKVHDVENIRTFSRVGYIFNIKLYNIIQYGYMSHIQSIFPVTKSHSIGVSPIFQQTHWTPAMAFVPGQGRLPLTRNRRIPGRCWDEEQ